MMKRVWSLVLVACLLVSSALLLSSCGEDKDDGAEVNVFFCGEVFDFDPAREYTNDNAVKVMSLLYEPLFVLNADGSVSNGLAYSYRIVENAEENEYKMIINLRDSWWSNGGAQVTADDVVFAWKRILACDFSCQAASLLFDVKNAVKVKQGDMTVDDLGISSDGKKELTIEFEGKIDYDAFRRNLTSVALVPLRENDVARNRETYWSKLVNTINCNGPFTLRTLEHGETRENGSFVLVRNKYYRRSPDSNGSVSQYVNPFLLKTEWRQQISPLSGVMDDYRKTEDDYDSLEEYLSNTIFYVGEIPLADRTDEEAMKNVVVNDLCSTTGIVFNTKEEPFNDYRVRLALSLAIDRNKLAERVVFARPATGLIPTAVKEGKSNASFREAGGDILACDANLDAAKELLRAAGIRASDYSFMLSVNLVSEEELAIAGEIVSAWKALGFSVSLNRLSYSSHEEKYDKRQVQDSDLQLAYAKGDFDAILLDFQTLSVDAFSALCAFSSELNGNGVEWLKDEDGAQTGNRILTHVSGFSDAYYDGLIDAAMAEKDIGARSAILHEAEAYLMTEMPIVPLLFNQSAYIAKADLSGLSVNGYGITLFSGASLRNYEKYREEYIKSLAEDDGE